MYHEEDRKKTNIDKNKIRRIQLRKMKVNDLSEMTYSIGNTRCGKFGCAGGLMDNGAERKSESRVQPQSRSLYSLTHVRKGINTCFLPPTMG